MPHPGRRISAGAPEAARQATRVRRRGCPCGTMLGTARPPLFVVGDDSWPGSWSPRTTGSAVAGSGLDGGQGEVRLAGDVAHRGRRPASGEEQPARGVGDLHADLLRTGARSSSWCARVVLLDLAGRYRSSTVRAADRCTSLLRTCSTWTRNCPMWTNRWRRSSCPGLRPVNWTVLPG